jgi:hypothetical protein
MYFKKGEELKYSHVSKKGERRREAFQQLSRCRGVLSKNVGWLACGVALAVALASFTVGCFTTVSDGAEVHHTRMSLGFYMAGKRAPHTPAVATENVPWDQFYYSDVLWPLLLSKLWLLAGQPSHALAQFYQAIWLFALLMGLYCLSRLYYDPWVSLLAMGLTISIPMVPAFGTLFLVNIPVMTLTLWALYAAHKLEQWPWVFALGLLVGGIYLTKRLNVAFFPGIVLIGIVRTHEGWRKCLSKLAVVAIVAAALIAIDLDYRSKHFNSRTLIEHKMPDAYSVGARMPNGVNYATIIKDWTKTVYEAQSLLNWKNSLKHIGPFLPLALALYVLGRHYERRDMIFAGLAALYAIAFIAFYLRIGYLPSAPIYYLPSFVLMTVPAAKGLKILWQWRFGRIGLLVFGILTVLQLILVFQEVHKRRQLPADMAEAYKFIRKSLPDDGKVFLCSGFGLELHTQRVSTIRSVMPRIFFHPGTSWKARAQVLDELNIGYIIYREDCIYDDQESRVIWDAAGGMPLSFFKGLERLSNYKLIFKNDSVSIWRVNQFP